MPHIIYYSGLTCQVGEAKKMTLLETMGKLDEADFRVRGRCQHKASDIAVITICALISGGTSYYDFEAFGRDRLDWLRGFLDLPNGIPSHDTFRRFWSKCEPARMNALFMEWVDSLTDELPDGDGIHVDGKCLRRALTKDGRQPCIVSAYSSKDRIVIGQVKADEKSNEITAIPGLLNQLFLSGAIVTIDAAGCQRNIVKTITEKNGDYLISLKGNQETMHDEIRELFEASFRNGVSDFRSFKAEPVLGHGRVEKRTCWQTDYLDWFKDRPKWAGLRSVCMIETERMVKKTGETSTERRFFISSLPVDPEKALRVAVRHWDVENPLHWTLDMVFDEDHSRARSEHAAENLAIMRHFAYDMIRCDKVTKGGMSRRKKSMTWSAEKLLLAIKAA